VVVAVLSGGVLVWGICVQTVYRMVCALSCAQPMLWDVNHPSPQPCCPEHISHANLARRLQAADIAFDVFVFFSCPLTAGNCTAAQVGGATAGT
jgi:hypothetical protein